MSWLSELAVPVLGAPMAGGPSRPELVVAVGRAGGLGFLAGGYSTAADLAARIAAVRATGVPFGVNLFAPTPIPVDPAALARYTDVLRPEAERYGVELPAPARASGDGGWAELLDLLIGDPVPVVSVTFDLPDIDLVRRLQATGTAVVATVTSPEEALAAASTGVDALVVQSAAAGGHSGTLTPDQPPTRTDTAGLVAAVAGTLAAAGSGVALPLLAAGGLGTGPAVRDALAAGAAAVVVGTALLRTTESGASALYRDALVDPGRDATVVTNAFTGRPARALPNRFTRTYSDLAPLGFPAVHLLTAPIRAAAAAAGDPEAVNLWAGTAHRDARAVPAADVLADLVGPL